MQAAGRRPSGVGFLAHLRVLSRFLLQYAWRLVRARKGANDGEFLQTAYRVLLKRAPDLGGMDHYLDALAYGSMSRWDVLRSIAHSSEFEQVCGLPIHPLEALHGSRKMLIRRCLPPARTVVDLGGAAPGFPEGALLAMGYPHHPSKIWIVDLPPAQRVGGSKGAEPYGMFVTADGIHVQYIYGSMVGLSPIPDQCAELVWSGQSIEHVTEQDADIVCREAYRVLKLGGSFCLDTPNAALTRMQSPGSMIHPEHKKEYVVPELWAKLERTGFRVVEAKGLCPMPNSLRRGVFDLGEMARNVGLCERPEEGYLFYLSALKCFA